MNSAFIYSCRGNSLLNDIDITVYITVLHMPLLQCLLLEAEWCIDVPLNWVIIVSGNGLSPVWRQAIIWTKGDLLIEILQIKGQWNLKLFIYENAYV